MSIYVLDKSFDILKEYESIIKKLYPKNKTKYFTNCTDLVDKIKEDPPNIVIVDTSFNYWIMTVKKIKEIDKRVRVIVSAVDSKHALDSIQNGVNGYLIKPFTINSLKEAIDRK